MRRGLGLFGALGAFVIATATLVAGPSTAANGWDKPPGSSDGPDGVPRINWTTCTDEFLQSIGAECGTLRVPLDYDEPDGRKVTLALSRLKHTVPERDFQGAMLVNPGGPGGSGLQFSFLGLLMPDDVRAAYDWIGFDPRGVGASTPSLSCIPDYFAGPRPDYDIDASHTKAQWRKRSKGYADACATAGGDLLDHVKTIDTVRDMNSIRAALRSPKLNFYGFSYGTYLTQVYTTTFPWRVGRMVLDPNVDPRQVWYRANLDQDVAFETVIDLFFDWIARHSATYQLGSTAAEDEAAYYTARAELAASPMGVLGPSELSDAVLPAGYLQAFWPDIAQALSDLVVRDDPAALIAWYESFDDPGNDNGYAMYLATECTDQNWPRLHRLIRDSRALDVDNPFLSWANAWFNAPCTFWRGEAATSKPYVHGKAPLLLVSETLDGATPYSGSLEVRRRFPNSVLIATDGGTTHANSLAGNACVDEPIFAYLRDGTLPARDGGPGAADVVCAPLPEPEPVVAVPAPAAAAGATDLQSKLRSAVSRR